MREEREWYVNDPFSLLRNLAGANEHLSPSLWREPQAMKQK